MAPQKQSMKAYASKAPTDYHRWFAAWLVRETGYSPSTEESTKAAFLRGVSLATALRPKFMESDFLAEKREATGATKPGRKPAAEVDEEEETPRRRGRPAKKATAAKRRPEPEPDDEDEFDDADEDEFEDEDIEDDDDFDDDSEDDDFDEEEEETPKRRVAKKTTPAKRAPARKVTPAKSTRRAAKPADDDDEDLF